MPYQCPLCSEKLTQNKTFFYCINNHQFDIAKEGYVNLIPANRKRSKIPGDSIEMMQARRRFLNQNHYLPLRNLISQCCADKLIGIGTHILDIGCGEGYYTSELEFKLNVDKNRITVFGLDISKVAIRYAAKRYHHCHFSVASSQHLPFLDNTLDLILRIYAPCNTQEMKRCLTKGGCVVTVTPAARHLYQLRELIYENIHLHDETPEALEGFTLDHEEKLSYNMTLSGTDSLDLLQMTPFAWKATDKVRKKLAQANSFHCEADFMIRVYKQD